MGRNRWTLRRRAARSAMGAVTAVAVLAATGCAPALGPVAVGQLPNAPRVFDSADPAVLVDGGVTYLYGSTNNMAVPVRRVNSFTESLSTSQTAWAQGPVDAMPTRPSWSRTDSHGRWEIWAPSVAKIGSAYFMYFAARRSGAVDTHNDQCIGRARATRPMGPFAPEAAPIYCGLPPERGSNPWGRGALDPEFFRAPDGRQFLLVTLSRTRGNIATLPLDAAGRVVGGLNAPAEVLVSQKYHWHDGVPGGAMESNAFLENPSMVFEPKTGTYLLFFSAGSWWTSKYVTGIARCGSPTGPCSDDPRGPFLQNGNGRSGVGGLTVFRDAAGATRVAYASWQAGRESQHGSVGEYKRQTHWATLSVGNTTDPAKQSVTLR